MVGTGRGVGGRTVGRPVVDGASGGGARRGAVDLEPQPVRLRFSVVLERRGAGFLLSGSQAGFWWGAGFAGRVVGQSSEPVRGRDFQALSVEGGRGVWFARGRHDDHQRSGLGAAVHRPAGCHDHEGVGSVRDHRGRPAEGGLYPAADRRRSGRDRVRFPYRDHPARVRSQSVRSAPDSDRRPLVPDRDSRRHRRRTHGLAIGPVRTDLRDRVGAGYRGGRCVAVPEAHESGLRWTRLRHYSRTEMGPVGGQFWPAIRLAGGSDRCSDGGCYGGPVEAGSWCPRRRRTPANVGGTGCGRTHPW